MILSDKEILREMQNGNIVISPFDRDALGANSYDVHLSKYLAYYKNDMLDAKKDNDIVHFIISTDGFMLEPNKLYLGSTIEYTETHVHVPFLEGKSSTGRLGIDIHATAGKGDVGFCNHWTLEISCKQPVIIYEGMPIGQLIYYEVKGQVSIKYSDKTGAKYNVKNHLPVGSMMWRNNW